MKNILKKLTFQTQIYLGVFIALIGFSLTAIFQNGIFSNIAWIVYGLLFIVNPVYPKSLEYSKGEKKAKYIIRFAAILCIIIGIITRFRA